MSTFRVNTNVMAMNVLRNLGTTSDKFSHSVTRLSTGLRINSGADDPAGLQISEGFRAQITGLTQALRNNQDAVNFSKTAEGALNEASSLLNDARGLALANANDATLSTDQKQANQNQLTSILSSIDRIAAQTTYGTKHLLDGSAGVTASIVKTGTLASTSIGGNFAGTAISANDTVNVNVGTAAVKASVTGAAAVAATAVGATGNLTINNITFPVTASMTNQQMIDLINSRSGDTGVVAAITAGNLVFTATAFGTNANTINITNDTAGIAFAAAGTRTLGTTTAGVNAVATFTLATAGTTTGALTASGTDGVSFKDSSGNTFKLTNTAATTTGAVAGIAVVSVGSAQFQIGSNANQTASLSLGNTNSSSLGLGGIDITTVAGANAAIAAIDSAISSVAITRGNIGNFQRNVLESNIRTLGVAKENITASESSIRDTDVAEEMTMYTKLQILQQSGMAVLGQANAAPQAVLSLLKG